jgi:hypothetical protein
MLTFTTLQEMRRHVDLLIDPGHTDRAPLAQEVIDELRKRRLLPYVLDKGFVFDEEETSLVDLANELWMKKIMTLPRQARHA